MSYFTHYLLKQIHCEEYMSQLKAEKLILLCYLI